MIPQSGGFVVHDFVKSPKTFRHAPLCTDTRYFVFMSGLFPLPFTVALPGSPLSLPEVDKFFSLACKGSSVPRRIFFHQKRPSAEQTFCGGPFLGYEENKNAPVHDRGMCLCWLAGFTGILLLFPCFPPAIYGRSSAMC